MTDPSTPAKTAGSITPSRRDRLRPLELLVLSGIVAVFVGAIVLASTRDIGLGVIFLGVAFIATLLTLALLALSEKSDDAGPGGARLADPLPGSTGDEDPGPHGH